MTADDVEFLAGRLAAQDFLIALALGRLVASRAAKAEDLAAAIEAEAARCKAVGEGHKATVLTTRALQMRQARPVHVRRSHGR
ncbi:MAG TPA: hypothetical protein VFF48_10880 [Brevundimonas sp.]|nr:hypothetical protein [Brevundimonas sp.]